jgi:POT family proton-dependent oligopeptide transporter
MESESQNPMAALETSPEAGATLRQPRGLKIIFLTEMWERFSYYGNQALLVLYLVNSLGFRNADALSMYGTYTMLLYITPLFGGWIADKFLGLRLTAVIGAIVMMLGHFAMAVPSLLHMALGLLIIGNGFFKPSSTSLVGELYDGPEDARRDGGYTVYYMGINVGGILASLICGTLGETLGWHYGFASAGVGMAIGLITFVGWQNLLGRAGLREGQRPIGLHNLPIIAIYTAASGAVVLGVLWAWPALSRAMNGMPAWTLIATGVVLVAGIVALWRRSNARSANYVPLTRVERRRLAALAVVVVFVTFFFVCVAQAGGSMALFADKQTDRHVAGHEFPATWFQTINPMLVLLLAPLFSMLWTRINSSRFTLPDMAKIGLGMIVMGLSFVVMTVAQSRAGGLGIVGSQWLIGAYTLQTIGEVMLTPIALALLSRAAPERIMGLVMGLFLMTAGVANKVAGSLEEILDGSGVKPYFLLMAVSIVLGLVLMALTPMLTRVFDSRDVAEPSPSPLPDSALA